MKKSYLEIAEHYERCLVQHGDSHLGVDWPREQDLDTRHRIMWDLVERATNRPSGKVKLLDFGCGLSHMYEYLQRNGVARKVEYTGLDISREFVRRSEKKFPQNRYICRDVLAPGAKVPRFDYIVMNGIFTQKRGLSNDEMFSFLRKLVTILFHRADGGIAFNMMSNQVDFKRSAAFHLSFDKLAKFICADLSRNIVFRHDYGLYEYTTYIYKDSAKRSAGKGKK